MPSVSKPFRDAVAHPERLSDMHRESVAATLEHWAKQIRSAARVTDTVNQDQILGEREPVKGRNGAVWADWYPTHRTLEVSLTIELDQPPAESAA